MHLTEPRSWETTDLRIEPLNKPKPTNLDIAKMSNEIHACLEDHRGKTEASFTEVRGDIKSLRDRLFSPKSVASSSTFSSFMRNVWGTLTALGGCFLAYKIFAVLWPPLKAALESGRL